MVKDEKPIFDAQHKTCVDDYWIAVIDSWDRFIAFFFSTRLALEPKTLFNEKTVSRDCFRELKYYPYDPTYLELPPTSRKLLQKLAINANSKKISALLISRKRCPHDLPNINLFDSEILWRTDLKYVGLTFNTALRFCKHKKRWGNSHHLRIHCIWPPLLMHDMIGDCLQSTRPNETPALNAP